MNKCKQVSHSKRQETISIIFAHPFPNPSAPKNKVWQYNVADLTWPEIPKIIAALRVIKRC